MVELPGNAHGNGQVKRSDEYTVYPFHGSNGFDVFQTSHGFTLGNQQCFGIVHCHVYRHTFGTGISEAPAVFPGGAETTFANGSVFGVVHQFLHLLYGMYVRNDEPMYADIQQF